MPITLMWKCRSKQEPRYLPNTSPKKRGKMPAEKKQTPAAEQPEGAVEDAVQTQGAEQAAEAILPDAAATEGALPSESTVIDALKAELEKVKAKAETVESMSTKERERYEKMLKDTQQAFHQVTQKLAEVTKNSQQQLPPMEKGQTADEWMKSVLEKYEEDPKEGLSIALKGVLAELDSTRYTSLQAIKAAEEKAYRRALEQIPGYKDRQQKLKALDEQHPELADLPDEKKIVIIEAMEGAKKPDPTEFTGTTGSAQRVKTGGTDKGRAWLNDPEVLKQARSMGFTSKQELEQYAAMVNG